MKKSLIIGCIVFALGLLALLLRADVMDEDTAAFYSHVSGTGF